MTYSQSERARAEQTAKEFGAANPFQGDADLYAAALEAEIDYRATGYAITREFESKDRTTHQANVAAYDEYDRAQARNREHKEERFSELWKEKRRRMQA